MFSVRISLDYLSVLFTFLCAWTTCIYQFFYHAFLSAKKFSTTATATIWWSNGPGQNTKIVQCFQGIQPFASSHFPLSHHPQQHLQLFIYLHNILRCHPSHHRCQPKLWTLAIQVSFSWRQTSQSIHDPYIRHTFYIQIISIPYTHLLITKCSTCNHKGNTNLKYVNLWFKILICIPLAIFLWHDLT